MTHKTPDGRTILLPDMDIHAFVRASPAEFVKELLAKNPTLPATHLTKNNLLCCVMGKIARLGRAGPLPSEVKSQMQSVRRQWVSSTAGNVLHELFGGKLPKAVASQPTSVPSTASVKIPAPIFSAEGTVPRAVDTKRPAATPSAPKQADSNQSLTRAKTQSKASGSKSMSPYNPNVIVHIAQLLEQGYRKKLKQNGYCLLVSLPSQTGHTLTTTTTHAHLFDRTDRAGSHRQIQLVVAYYPSIVLAYASKAHKDLAARQIESLKFQFEDNDPIKLDVQGFSDSPASAQATYALGPGSLYFCDYRESLQRFFCNEGFVPINDVIKTRRTGVLKTELLVRYRFSPGLMEKLTAQVGGHRDNRIPAEPGESCSLCPRTTSQDRIQSSPKDAHQPNVKPSSHSGDSRAKAEISTLPFPTVLIPGPGLAAAHPSLDDLKITTYIAVLTLLNGVEITKKIPPRLFARGFNKFLNTFYRDSDFEARLAVLHRIDGGERAGDWELLCKEIRRYFTIEYMSDSGALSSKRKSLADDDEAARKRPKRAVAANYM